MAKRKFHTKRYIDKNLIRFLPKQEPSCSLFSQMFTREGTVNFMHWYHTSSVIGQNSVIVDFVGNSAQHHEG